MPMACGLHSHGYTWSFLPEVEEMLGAVIRKEFLNHIASFRFWVAAVLALVLTVFSTSIAARDYTERLRGYRERLADAQREISAATVYSSLQPLALRPPELLSILDQGWDAQLGTDVRIHVFGIPAHATRAQRGNELLASAPVVDLTRIVSVVLGLLALLLSYDAFVGEREVGTLRTAFSYGAGRRTMLAGKVLGGLAVLVLPLAASLAASLAVLRWQAGTAPTAGQWLRIAGLAGAYAAYLSLMFLLGLLLSLLTRSSSSALLIAVSFWWIAVLLLPQGARTLASSLTDTQQARRERERAQSAVTTDYEKRLARALQSQPILATFSGDTPVSLTSGQHRAVLRRFGSGAYYDALQRYHRFEVETGIASAEQLFRIDQQAEQRLRQGERLAAILSAASPSFLLERIADSFAGTSVAEQDRFLAACRAYRRTFIGYLESRQAFSSWRWFTDDRPGQLHPWPTFLGLTLDQIEPAEVRMLFRRLMDPAVEARIQRYRLTLEKDPSRRLQLAGMPRFSPPTPKLRSAFADTWPAILALLALNGAAVTATWLRFHRYGTE
jgi:ABC-type transport system involved in multi-copper enzyme maturation permease subunit